MELPERTLKILPIPEPMMDFGNGQISDHPKDGLKTAAQELHLKSTEAKNLIATGQPLRNSAGSVDRLEKELRRNDLWTGRYPELRVPRIGRYPARHFKGGH